MNLIKTSLSLLISVIAGVQHSNASLFFNGVNSKAVLDGSYLDAADHANYTFDVWIKPTTLGGTLFGKTEFWKAWILDITPSGGLMFTGSWPYSYWGIEVAPNSIVTGAWQNVACAVNNGQASIYVNGSLVGTEAVQNPISFRADASIGVAPYGVDGVMFIGYSDSGTTPDYNFFNGGLYGIRVWDRTLSAGEVNALATANVVPANGLKNAVLLDEGSGTTIHDSLTTLTGRNISAQWSADLPAVVPEPTAISLLGLGLLGLGCLRRR